MKEFVKRGICFAAALMMTQSMIFASPAEEMSGGVVPRTAVYVKSVSSGAGTGTTSGKVTLSQTSAKLTVGKTVTLKATVTPSSSSVKFTWSSSNSKVVSVDATGKVKAVGKGVAAVTVKASNGKSASCMVTVITADEAYIEEVFRLVNEERTKAGLSKVTLNTALCNAASKRAKEITTKFSHTRPDGTGWYTVLQEYKISYAAAVENIAYHYETPKAVVDGWMKSPNHKKNILNAKYKAMGIGLCRKDGSTYWAQIFKA